MKDYRRIYIDGESIVPLNSAAQHTSQYPRGHADRGSYKGSLDELKAPIALVRLNTDIAALRGGSIQDESHYCTS